MLRRNRRAVLFGLNFRRELGEFIEHRVGVDPVHDRLLERRKLTEIAIQPDDAVDVFGMNSALQKAGARGYEIRWISLQRETRRAITQRSG